MIPKIIHYCWFGGAPKNALFDQCYNSWIKYCPDFQIIEWNESNFSFEQAPDYVKEAYAAKKWAFVTDYVRFKVIYENGGIYFDTDVELIRPLGDLLEAPAFYGMQTDQYIATGLGFGSEKGTALLAELMKSYDGVHFLLPNGEYDQLDCPHRNHEVFERFGYTFGAGAQTLADGTLILAPEVLSPIDYRTGKKHITDQTLSIHWYSASWYKRERGLVRIFKRIFGQQAYLRCRYLKRTLRKWKQQKRKQ